MELIIKKQLDELVKQLDQNKAFNIKVYDVQGHSWITDYIIVTNINNVTHTKLIIDIATQFSKQAATKATGFIFNPVKISGEPESGWVVLDFNSFICHCLTEEKQDFYDIDALFSQYAVVHYH